VGDAGTVLRGLPADHFNCCVTSPPYFGVKVYGDAPAEEIGPERTYPEYVSRLVGVFREVRRCLRPDGVLWLVVGDSFFNYRTGHKGGMPGQSIHKGAAHGKPDRVAGCHRRAVRQPGLKEKDLMGVPWRLALALQDDGWYLRMDVVWAKPNPTPERVRDRPTRAHEYVFPLTKSSHYEFDSSALREAAVAGGDRNGRSYWVIPAESVKGHNAAFPRELARRCVLSGSPAGGHVLDPFAGSGTTPLVAHQHGRTCTAVELYPKYAALLASRLVRAGVPVNLSDLSGRPGGDAPAGQVTPAV
jgi:site-specific DNA-methyltransferase (adenine-specific)